jgi:predicted secreted protein
MPLFISAEQLNWESERKIQQLEQNWQLQMSSTRATLELVKEQMERDAQDRLDAAEEKHRKQLGARKYSSLECPVSPSLLHWGTSAAGVMCVCVYGLG